MAPQAEPAAPEPPRRQFPYRPAYSNEQIINGIESSDNQVRGATYSGWLKTHEQLVEQLICTAKAKRVGRRVAGGGGVERRDPRELAIKMIGKMRVLEAVPWLIENIDDYYPGYVREDSPFACYPCAEALNSIGASCVPQMLATPVKESSEKAIELHAWLLIEFSAYNPFARSQAAGVVERYLALPDVVNSGPKNCENLQRLAQKVRELANSRKQE